MMNMKKIMILIICLLLVGCSNKTTCIKEETNEKINILIVSTKDSIKNINIKSQFRSNEDANNYCTLLKLTDINVECKENIIIYKNYKDYLDINFTNKNELVEYLKSNNYNCK